MVRTVAPAISSSRKVANGNASLDKSASVACVSTSRASGPISPSTAVAIETSVNSTSLPSGMLRSIQLKSRAAEPVPVTM